MSEDIKKYYGNESIETIDNERDQVRQRPTIFFGTNDVRGCAHGTFELVTNSLDEIREGYGNFIKVIVEEDNVITVIDNGRGVPMGFNKNKNQYNWHLVYNKLYASGKYDSTNYGASAGLNGVGAAITQFASTFMKVVSCRKELIVENGKEKFVGKKYTMNFKNGYPVGDLIVENYDGPTGTATTYQPDKEVFLDVDVPIEIFADRFRRMAMLVPNATIVLDYKGAVIKFNYPNGTAGYIQDICEDKIIKDVIQLSGEMEGRDDENREDSPIYKAKIDVAFTFSNDMSFKEVYHNGLYLQEGGTSYEGFRQGLIAVLDDYAKKNGKLALNQKFTTSDVEEILIAVISTECPGNISYLKGQYKSAIGNPMIKKLAVNTMVQEFRKWAAIHKEEMDKIIDAILLNREARLKAESVKKKVIEKLKKDINTIGGKPEKFVPAVCNDPRKTELYICEGDSAKGSVLQARNKDYQAVMPLRGKILNCLKVPLETIMDNSIIIDLVRVIGCGVEPRSKYMKDLPKFDLSNLNFNKIIICTDADVDGGHIRCLVITMIYRLMPTLLKKGYVYIAETPLFSIAYGKEKLFAYNEEERDKIVNNLKGQGARESQIRITRLKGLGENNPDDMHISTMNPSTRRLVKVEYPEDDKQFVQLLESLMGNDLDTRKEIISKYFDEVEVDIA